MVTALALLLVSAAAPARCTRGTEEAPPLCALNLPGVRALTIDRNAARDPQGAPDTFDCRRFRLSNTDVRKYLRHAKITDPQSADATLDRSACYAQGTLRLVDGRGGRWRIERLRVGTLKLEGEPERLLFCPRCQRRPFGL